MIKFTATNALVHTVTPVTEIPSKSGGNPFYKRELILDDSWERDGRRFDSFVKIEFTGDRMAQLDGIQPGQRVNVEGLINGREYNGTIYNTVRGTSVAVAQPQQGYAPQQPQPQGYAPQPQGYAPQQPQPQGQYAPAYPQQVNPFAAPQPQGGGWPQQDAPF